MAEQLGYKYTNTSNDVCEKCFELIRKGKYNILSSKNKQHPCAPCYPGILDYPHVCGLQMVHFVNTAYQNGSITKDIFRKWMELNSMDYHPSDSDFAFKLWDERLNAFSKDAVALDMSILNNRIYIQVFLRIPSFIQTTRCPIHDTVKINFKLDHRYNLMNTEATDILHEMFPPPSKGDGKKINLPLTQLVNQMLRDGHVDKVNTVFDRFCIGTIENIVTMHLVNSLGNPSYSLFQGLMVADHACCLTDRQYNDYAKAIGVAVRRCSRWVDGTDLEQESICQLSYWEMCLGRLTNKSDWDQEEQNRCTDPMYLKLPYDAGPATKESNDRFLSRMRPHLVKIFQTLMGTHRNDMSWSDFLQQRQLWVTGGSAGGEKVVIDGESRRIDKKVLFEKLSRDEMIFWLDTIAILEAVASDKFEIGKPRSIYGASPMSYMILTYLTREIESRLSLVEGFEDGLDDLAEIDALLNRMKAAGVPGVHTTMVDYADFNLQHTIDAQYMMFDVIHQLTESLGYHPDMIKAADWARKAMLNQWVKFPHRKEYLRVKQGMFSGVRTTNLMNTILNKAYFMTVNEIVTTEMNIIPDRLLAIHKGDDVWLSNHNLVYAIAIYIGMLCCNFVFIPSKQLLGFCGEFLRIRYWKDHMLGYLCRAIGSLIERPAQSAEVSTPAVMLQGLRSQVNILYRRGLALPACNLVWTVMERFWHNIKHPKYSNVSIPKSVIRKSHYLNGLDLGPPRTLPVGGISTPTIPVIKHKLDNVARVIPDNMTNDYMVYLSSTLQKPFRIKSVAAQIHLNNVVGAASSKEKFAALKLHANELVVWKKSFDDTGGVTREETSFDEYLSQPIVDKELIAILDRIENKDTLEKIDQPENSVGRIFKAIHSSPFRDVSIARRALGVGYLQAAEICILENPNAMVRENAYNAFLDIKQQLGNNVLSRIISKSGCSSNNFECLFHPIVLAWLNIRSVNEALNEALKYKVKDVQTWDEILQYKQRIVISTAYKHGLLLRVAGY